MPQKLKFGIIGFGRIGQVHAQCLLNQVKGAELVAISDPFWNDGHNRWLEERGAEGLRVHLEAEKILEDEQLDAVLICSSTDTHAQYIEQAAAARKHIFCEKPIDLNAGRIRAVLQAVEKAGVLLQIGFQRRFDHNFCRLHEDLVSGRLGQANLLRITSRDPQPPPLEYIQVSGGLFLDMMIHDFDMARFLFGEVAALQAVGACLADPAIGRAGDIDTAVVTLQFQSGALGVIDNSRRAAYGYDQRVEVFGSLGMSLCDNDYPHNVRFFGKERVEAGVPLHFFLERYQAAYTRELESFVSRLRLGGPVEVDGLDGLRAVELGLAAKESLVNSGAKILL